MKTLNCRQVNQTPGMTDALNRKKAAATPNDQGVKDSTSASLSYMVPSYQPTPILQNPTPTVEITDLQRQMIEIKEDNAATQQMVITKRQKILKEVTEKNRE